MVSSRRLRRALLVGLSIGMVALLAACQVNVTVDTVVNSDGSGTVTVGVGLDEKALSRVGDPNTAIHVDDLKATGWTIAPAEKGPDGVTWLKASKPFADPAGLDAIMKELTSGTGAFRGFTLEKDDSLTSTTWKFSGTVDLTGGLDQFGDSELAGALNGDPLGGNVAAIEKEEGKPATQMIAVDVSVKLPNADRQDWKPTFADPAATQINAQSVQSKPVVPLPLPSDGGSWFVYLVVVGVLGAAVVMLFVLRRRFTRAH
jgi:hypothetical protein